MKKFVCLLLAGLMAFSAVSCAKTDESKKEETDSSTTAGTETETGNMDYVCELPKDLNYHDEEINIIYAKDTGREDELVSNQDGGVVSTAVHERNVIVEDQLHVKLKMFDSQDVAGMVNKDIQANLGEYELVVNGTYLSITPAMEGKYIDLNRVGNIDLSKHYWTQGYNDMVTFTDDDMQFLATGSVAISSFRYMFLTIYNKELMKSYGYPDLYETVKAGDWTLDKQYEMVTGHYFDKDGDSMRTLGDGYGFATGDIISVDPYMVAADLHMIIKDDTGALAFNSDALAPLSDLCDKVQKLYNDDSTFVFNGASMDDVGTNDIMDMFTAGNTLMATTMFLKMELNFEDLVPMTYGIAPMPKFSKQQDSYYSYVQDRVSSFGISAVVGDEARRDMLGAVLEALAYHSYRLVRPAYYDTALSQRYMQDPQSQEILDMIFNTLQFDFSSSCSNIFSNCVMRDQLRPLLSGKKNTIASKTKAWKSAVSKYLRKYNAKLEEIRSEYA